MIVHNVAIGASKKYMLVLTVVLLTAVVTYYYSSTLIAMDMPVFRLGFWPTSDSALADMDHLKQSDGLKSILLWNSPERIEVAAFGTGHQPFIDAGCRVSDCSITANSSAFWTRAKSKPEMLQSFDAVLINVHELWLSSLPSYRRPLNQRIVFLTQESPQSMEGTLDPSLYDGFFNWTMTYKRNSDIQLLYGRLENLTTPLIGNGTTVKRKKEKLVAWMVSHCPTPSEREDYVTQLQIHVPVDIYGDCGTLSCPRNETHWLSTSNCYESLSAKYKFYLSFENSICNDYVTEKFFNILLYDMVPVVFGGADYERIAPPHSFINALDFSGPADLARYLKTLDEDDDEYYKYFEWKSSYRVESGVEQMARHAFCDLCDKLHRSNEPTKIYTSLASEWSSKTQCRQWNHKPTVD